MKKVFLTIVLLSSFLLTGCVNDKKNKQQISQQESQESQTSQESQETTKPSHVDINPPSYF